MPKQRAVAGFVVVMLAACGGEGVREASGPVVRDSAGVEIVENQEAAWAPGEEWTIAAQPAFEVGSLDGDDSQLFNGASSPRLRSDGSVVVADGGSAEVRAFDAQGDFLWAAGGRGEGPGEFQTLRWIALLPGDSIMAYDFRSRRVTILGPDGQLVRTYTPDTAEDALAASPVTLLEGGRVLAAAGVRFSGGEGPAREVTWPETSYFVTDLEGARLDSLMTVPSVEMLVLRDEGSIAVAPPPIARRGFVGARGNHIVSGQSQAIDLAVRDATGALVRRVRLGVEGDVPVDGDLERAIEGRLGPDADPEQLRAQLRTLADVPLPDRYPVVEEAIVERDGTIWLRIWRPPWSNDGASGWRVFDPSGAYLGDVKVPAGFRIFSVEGDRLLGVYSDDLGVERVRMYDIVR